jgi:peptide/nickel transport system permease protein
MTAALEEAAPQQARARRAARAPRRRGIALPLAWAVLALLALAALWPGLLAGQAPDAIDPVNALAPPGSGHLMGTDQLGRDVFSRVVHGTRTSLLIGFGSTALGVAGGALLGVVSAASGRVVDEILMRATDILLAFPGLLLALLVVAALGPGSRNAAIAIGVSMIPGVARVARGQALAVRGSDYVRAAVVLGHRRGAVLLRHLLPNSLPPLLVLATVNTGSAIIYGSTLSFLGLGPQAPAVEWGGMLAQSRDYLEAAWAISAFPGAAVLVTVIAVTVVGRDLQNRFEGGAPDGGR